MKLPDNVYNILKWVGLVCLPACAWYVLEIGEVAGIVNPEGIAKILYVNASVRKESRTKRLAERLLEKLNDNVEEVKLSEIRFPTVDENFLNKRDALIASGAFDDPLFDLARQFAAADAIVIAAPYYDLSFPASLKQYLEQINVVGITFRYSPEGVPIPLCRAKKLYYITTAGGTYVPEEFGYSYVKALAEGFYGIQETEMIRAVGLDINGADVEGIMNSVKVDAKLERGDQQAEARQGRPLNDVFADLERKQD